MFIASGAFDTYIISQSLSGIQVTVLYWNTRGNYLIAKIIDRVVAMSTGCTSQSTSLEINLIIIDSICSCVGI